MTRDLDRVVNLVMANNMEFFKQYSDNPGFNRWLADNVFALTYGQG